MPGVRIARIGTPDGAIFANGSFNSDSGALVCGPKLRQQYLITWVSRRKAPSPGLAAGLRPTRRGRVR